MAIIEIVIGNDEIFSNMLLFCECKSVLVSSVKFTMSIFMKMTLIIIIIDTDY